MSAGNQQENGSMDKNDVGAGYIALKIGDTVQTGDQRYLDFCWVPVPKRKIGTVLKRMYWPMRRKSEVQVPETPKETVDPGPGYRLLDGSEIVAQDDQYLDAYGHSWKSFHFPSRHGWDESYELRADHPAWVSHVFRRKVSEPQEAPSPVPGSPEDMESLAELDARIPPPAPYPVVASAQDWHRAAAEELAGKPVGTQIFRKDPSETDLPTYNNAVTHCTIPATHEWIPKPFTPNKYTRDLVALDGRKVPVDVYSVLAAFPTGNSAIDHAVKKQLAPGQRGQKDRLQDLKEARASLDRAIQMEGG